MAKRGILIIGCGYLGRELLTQIPFATDKIWATTRSGQQKRPSAQIGTPCLAFNLDEPASWPELEVIHDVYLDIYFLVPPSQFKLQSLHNFVGLSRGWSVHRAILASSSVVYGNQERVVDADAEVLIDSARAERQYAVEQAWKTFGDVGRIVRFAGIYGPDRIIGRQTLITGRLVAGDPQGWLNLIHVEDAAGLLVKVANSETAGIIELGCDGKPVRREQYYSDLGEFLDCKPPLFDKETETGSRGRICDNLITVQRTGWQPACIDYTKGWL